MNGIPEPYPNKTRVVYESQIVVVTDHAPHGEDWRYTGHRASLTGGLVHFNHYEVTLAPAAVVNSHDVDETEAPDSPLEELIRAVAETVHRGLATPSLYGAYRTYIEMGT